ncbi:signal recognition particle-docking protein FtsY [Uliginosibacterium sp. 31-16]|uniref:signal recognition particle-docking protein FtsY n=1 Tax=Uliginosibacterium sp. 31-16 TaxID=3068315 RepID=UPI00273FB3CC|nr:signal recognition particle-docking protein FtsY [Uliginosibacterium sp. 31-16]MDP5241162.1 signal recognition particle-docking protein FtsY [Uliginosibacterium sp. 31-16]
MFSFFKKSDKAEEAQSAPAAEVAPSQSWLTRLKAGLSRTSSQLGSVFSLRRIDEELLEELEATLLMADCGVEATNTLLAELRRRWKHDKLETGEELRAALAEHLVKLLRPLQQPMAFESHKPFIIMLAGVNGAGKTTSIGKLANFFQQHGKSVLLAAGDTFRAAAREQLVEWGNRNHVTVIAQDGGDPAAVAFDAISAAKARGIDVVMIDTAGRLPTQMHLMDEIAKVRRVIQKAEPTGPHEVLLVLDGNVGQNALAQLKAFDKAIGVTGLIITKLDGTAKGGVIAAIARTHPKPLRFIGVGEGIEDLQPFMATEYVDALLATGNTAAAEASS